MKNIDIYKKYGVPSRLPVAIASGGHHVRQKAIRRSVSTELPEATYNQSLIARKDTWAIAETRRSACDARPVVSGKLSLRCDEETWSFVNKKHLVEPLMGYLAIAASCFNLTRPPSCRLVHDPENDDRYLLADVEIEADTAEVLDSEDRFRSMVINSISADALYLIRLSYNIK